MFRRRVIDEMAHQIRHTTQGADDGRCSIIAHSFGTYVIARILAEHTDLRFQRIIFCGSVVPHTFRFEDHRSQFDCEIINEVGTRDILPVLAETSTFGYGSGGTYGFRRPGVRDRWHNGKAHSDFLTDAFCSRFWVPYLRDGTIAEDDPRPEGPPAWIALVRLAQPRFVLIVLIALALWWVSQRQ
jgi:hypothetical protein